MTKKILFSGLAVCFFLLGGCQQLSTANLQERHVNAHSVATNALLEPLVIQTSPFQLQSFFRITENNKPLRIYIEGDGLAWISKNHLSEDPTPINPVALKLAALDKSPNVLYLARPCQFVTNRHCSPTYWSDKRFSQEVIDATSQAIDIVKRHFKIAQIELVGFSGGASVAVLAAAPRQDVLRITTIAGNLDHEYVNRLHNVTPLYGSLNPTDEAVTINHIPQLHLVGSRDSLIPESVAHAFAEASKDTSNIQIKLINASHNQGWTEIWPTTLKGHFYTGT